MTQNIIPEAKAKAARVRHRLNSMGFAISQAQSLEVVATCFGDLSWAAMRARLSATTEASPEDSPKRRSRSPVAKLNVYNIALYAAVNGDRSAQFICKRTVMSRTQKQAKVFVDEKFFPAHYKSSGYAYATFEVEPLGVVENSNAPMLEDISEWLVSIFQSSNTPVDSGPFQTWLTGYEPEPFEDFASASSDDVLNRLIAAYKACDSAMQFFNQLYATLPEDCLYSNEDENSFGFI